VRGGEAGRLLELRAGIERVDREIVALIAQRLELARAAGPLKRALGVPVLDPAREAAIVRRAAVAAREEGVEDDAVRSVFWQLVGLCRRAQQEGG
jgi:chorismate mutase